MKWFDLQDVEEETEDITAVEAVEVPVVALVEDTRVVDPVVVTKVLALQEVVIKVENEVPVEDTKEAAPQRGALNVHDMRQANVLLVEDIKAESVLPVVTKEIAPKEVLVALLTEATVHDQAEDTKVQTVLPEVVTKEAALNRIVSEAEQTRSVISDSTPVLLELLNPDTEGIGIHRPANVLSQTDQDSVERNEKIAVHTKREHMKLLVIVTMRAEPKKLGQAVRKKTYSVKNFRGDCFGSFLYYTFRVKKFGLYAKIDTITPSKHTHISLYILL